MENSHAAQDGSDDPGFGLDSFKNPRHDQGLSLDQISSAFARLLGQGSDPYREPVADPLVDDPLATLDAAAIGLASDADDAPAPPDQPSAIGDAAAADPCEISPRSILEAMLFVGHPQRGALTSERVAGLMRGVRAAEIDDLVRDLNAQYLADRCPYEIVSEGGAYCLELRAEFNRLRDKVLGRQRQARLSRAAIEVLSLVAYQGPLTSEQVAKLRAAPSGAVLSLLVRRQLLRIERPASEPRTPVYHTTDRFLALFGLASLDDLPRSQDPTMQ